MSSPIEIPAVDPHTTGATVLVCDDHSIVREVTCSILERAGYRTVAASDAAGAKAQVRHHTGDLDVVVLDIRLPDQNGRELCAELLEEFPKLRCLLVSGAADECRIDGTDARVGFLLKPFRPRQLLEELRQLMSGT